MILTSYFDESGTHGGSPLTIVAGVWATANYWRLFERDFSILKRRYGIRTFHTKEFKSKAGDFTGWSNQRCLALARDLALLTTTKPIHAIRMLVTNEEYQRDYRTSEKMQKLRLDSPYGLAFRHCLNAVMMDVIERLIDHKDFERLTLNVVVERGHKNAGDALRAYGEEVAAAKAAGVNFLGELSFADKETDPLAIADFVAYLAFSRATRPPKIRRGAPLLGQAPPPEKATITDVTFAPGALAETRADLVARLEARRAYGAARHLSRQKGDRRPQS